MLRARLRAGSLFEDGHVNKDQKAAAVEEIAERLGEADTIFAVDYRGISVPEAAELRASLREADATFRVVKNRLAKRAAEEAGTTELQELFDGPIALTFVKGDAVIAAKAIFTFARQHEVLEYRGGLMDGNPLDPEQFRAIARLPGLDVLHGQLVGVTASPLTGLTRGLASMLSGLAVAMGEIAEKGLVGGDAEPPAQEEQAEEPAAEEASDGPAADGDAREELAAEEEAEEEPPAEAQAEDAAPDVEPTPGTETSDETESEETPEESDAESEGSEGSDSEEESSGN
jgi:large subunit ribosomal protein L10